MTSGSLPTDKKVPIRRQALQADLDQMISEAEEKARHCRRSGEGVDNPTAIDLYQSVALLARELRCYQDSTAMQDLLADFAEDPDQFGVLPNYNPKGYDA